MCSRHSPLTEVEREIGKWIINVNERSGGRYYRRKLATSQQGPPPPRDHKYIELLPPPQPTAINVNIDWLIIYVKIIILASSCFLWMRHDHSIKNAYWLPISAPFYWITATSVPVHCHVCASWLPLAFLYHINCHKWANCVAHLWNVCWGDGNGRGPIQSSFAVHS